MRTWPTTQARALSGNRTGDPWFAGWHSTHWATPARALLLNMFKTSITESYFNKSLWIWELRGLLESEFLRQLKRKINCRWWVTEGEAVCFPRKGQRGMTREREGRGNEWRGRLSDANCGGSSRRTQHGGIWERPSPHGHFGLSPNTVYPEPWNQRYFPTK